MERLLLISNRLPVSVEKKKRGIQLTSSPGGLASGLASFYESYDSTWIGWCGLPRELITKKEEQEIGERLLKEYSCQPIHLSREEVRMHYQGFCNKTIWPLFHYFTEYTDYNEKTWELYQEVNQRFADATLEIAEKDDIIWIHDYQLMLLPKLLRERLPKSKIGFFLHIPFPSYEVFRMLPWRRPILEGLLGADLVGFHTFGYVRHFLSSVRSILGAEHSVGQITYEDRLVKADAFPMGIDFDKFSKSCEVRQVRKEISRIEKKVGSFKVILSVDRLDYTKGILQRLETFGAFLEKNPDYREKVTLVLVAVPSRSRVDTYRRLKSQLDESVGRINGRYATIGWTPVLYLYRSLPWHQLTAFYRMADVALVTPVRDGMNLIAKEYVATKKPEKGVLILSETAGASEELGEALLVNPNNQDEVVEAIEEAFRLSDEEKRKANESMQNRLRTYQVEIWAKDFIETLMKASAAQKSLRSRKLTEATVRKMVEKYKKSSKRLLMLDYDGTLKGFARTPEQAYPDKALLDIVRHLAAPEENEIVIISGRDKNTIEQWFGELPVNLCAEHGVWIKPREHDWETLEEIRDDWKDEIRPIMSQFVDRTPGSFLEEKNYSLVWHYRRTNPHLAEVRIGELKAVLLSMTENLDLGLMDGNKVLEIKNLGINKGAATLRWLNRLPSDFILALGDDITDEDIFEVLPDTAYSIKVGLAYSHARYNLSSVDEVRSLLGKLVNASKG